MEEIKKILDSDDAKQLKAFFAFSQTNSNEEVLFKFNLWGRKLFPKYFESPDAPFHETINTRNLQVYRGHIASFVDIAFRGAGKDVKTKLFIAFCILNDLDHYRRYFKVLAEDGTNSKQTVTDIYNMLVNPKVAKIWPEVFEKTSAKREETMSSFTTATGVKVLADTVGTEQRGAIQEDARPDFIWFNDFETRKTLRSAKTTKAIWENMEEARTGLSKDGGCVYTCNYISEQGNVHTLVTKPSSSRQVLIVPILDENGEPTWSRYTKEEIENMRQDDEDFEGERMCKPSASKDVYFDRESLEKMEKLQPTREVAGFKIFKEYDPTHRYAGGHDVGGGVGLDSSTSVFIDFDTIPAQVVGTYNSNTIQPEAFGHECYDEADRFGGCLIAIENNKFDAAVLKAKLLGAKQYSYTSGKATKVGSPSSNKTFGWNTNALTKPKMFSALKKAVVDGLISLNDKDLIAEAMSYTRNDLIDTETDPRLTTRHFDLLTACAIAWQMKDFAEPASEKFDMDAFTKQELAKKDTIYSDIGI